MSPGDPVRNMYSANGVMPTEEMVEQTREEMGLNDPFVRAVWQMAWITACMAILEPPIQSKQAGYRAVWQPVILPTLKLTLHVYC